MKLLILLISSIFSHILAYPDVGIIGGQDAVEGQFPFQVSVQEHSLFTYEHFCGGSIIAPKWIVTAGHCHSYGLKFQIVAGILNLDEKSEYKQTIAVNRTIVHEDYIGNANPNDIALIELNEPLVYNERIQPIPLPTPGLETVGASVTCGWGQTGGNLFPILPKILQYANYTILGGQECYDTLTDVLNGGRNPFNQTTNVCTGDPEGGHAICRGDSGSALIQNGTLIGISSWGITPCGQKNAPSVFTKVSNYIDWINKHMKD